MKFLRSTFFSILSVDIDFAFVPLQDDTLRCQILLRWVISDNELQGIPRLDLI